MMMMMHVMIMSEEIKYDKILCMKLVMLMIKIATNDEDDDGMMTMSLT